MLKQSVHPHMHISLFFYLQTCCNDSLLEVSSEHIGFMHYVSVNELTLAINAKNSKKSHFHYVKIKRKIKEIVGPLVGKMARR